MSNEQYQFPTFDNDEYIKEYKGNPTEEVSKEKPVVWDTFLTNNEISAIHSSINLLGDKIDNTYEDEWNDEEEEQQYKETLKYLCRVVHRIYDQDGRSLWV